MQQTLDLGAEHASEDDVRNQIAALHSSIAALQDQVSAKESELRSILSKRSLGVCATCSSRISPHQVDLLHIYECRKLYDYYDSVQWCPTKRFEFKCPSCSEVLAFSRYELDDLQLNEFLSLFKSVTRKET